MKAYYSAGDYPKALEECKKALALYPGSASAHGSCATIYVMMDRMEEALSELTLSIRIDREKGQENANTFNTLGHVYMKQGNNQAALDAFDKATTIDAKLALAFYNKGLTHNRMRQSEKAKDDFRRAILADAKYADAHWQLAMICDEQGDVTCALDAYQNFKSRVQALPEYLADVAHANDRIKALEAKIPPR